MKHIKVFVLALFLFVAFTGCTQNLTLHQSQSDIVQIDLVYSPFGENEVLYTLGDDEISTFLDKLMALKLHKASSPQDIGGTLSIQIIYANTSVEILGTASVGYLPQNGPMEHDGWYYLMYDDLYALFSEYIDFSVAST